MLLLLGIVFLLIGVLFIFASDFIEDNLDGTNLWKNGIFFLGLTVAIIGFLMILIALIHVVIIVVIIVLLVKLIKIEIK
jgi:hypothetical protein